MVFWVNLESELVLDQYGRPCTLTCRDAMHLMQVRELGNPGKVFAQLMDLAQELAARGLVHCDLNEFNILVSCAHLPMWPPPWVSSIAQIV